MSASLIIQDEDEWVLCGGGGDQFHRAVPTSEAEASQAQFRRASLNVCRV
jgi:hypothetical protein